MTTNSFLVESRNFFPRRDWPWVIRALRQDEVVFKSLLESEFSNYAFSNLPASAELWSPASLALLKLSDPPSIRELTISPIRSLEKSLRNEVASAYADWIKDPKPVQSLELAGLLALSLRERLRIKGSWSGIRSELENNIRYLEPVIACLYGMIPQPLDLLKAFLEGEPEIALLDICFHALLSFPNPPVVQLEIIKNLFEGNNPYQTLTGLRILSQKRPELARDLSSRLALDHNHEKILESFGKGSLGIERWINKYYQEYQLNRLAQLLFIQEFGEFTSTKQTNLTIINESLDILNRLQLGLTVKLADQSKNGRGDQEDLEGNLRIWKQATRLAPDKPEYSAALANALFKSGRIEDARAYLEAREVESSDRLHPIIPLTSARIAAKTHDLVNAEKEAVQALKIIETSDTDSLQDDDYLFLSSFFAGLKDYKKAEDAAEVGVSRFHNSAALHKQLASIQISNSNSEQAVLNACNALAIDEQVSGETSEESSLPASHSILIEALEQEGNWQAALDERIDQLEKYEKAEPTDLQKLAFCAIRACQFQLAINACRQTLEIDPGNGISFTLLAKAYYENEDLHEAIAAYEQGLQASPNLAVPWIDLAYIYRMNGEEEKFFETLNAAVLAAPDSPEIYLSLAEAYLERNALTQAVERLRIADALVTSREHQERNIGADRLDIRPMSFENDLDLTARISYRLGQGLYRLGYRDEANKILEKAYEQSIKEQIGKNKFGQVGDLNLELAHLYAKTLIAAGDHENALEVLRFVVNEKPEDPNAALDLARELLLTNQSARNASEAIFTLIRAYPFEGLDVERVNFRINLENRDQDLEALTLYAEALAATEEIQKAKDVFRIALENSSLEESSFRVRLCLGLSRVAVRLGEPEMALASLREAVIIEPNKVEIHKGLTEIYRATGLLEDSLSSAQKVLELEPDNHETLIWQADQLSQLVELDNTEKGIYKDEAIKACKAVLQNDPGNVRILLKLAKTYLRNNNSEDALDITENLSDSPDLMNNASALDIFELGVILNDLGQSERAIRTIESAIEMVKNPELTGIENRSNSISEMYGWLSMIRYQKGEIRNAVRDIDEALNVKPDQPEFYIKKVNLLLELHDSESAKDCIISGLSQFPDDDRLYKCAARLYFLCGEIAKSIQYAEIAINVEKENLESAESDPGPLLAAELARTALQPLRAMSYLERDSGGIVTPENELRRNCLMAELALDASNPVRAHTVLGSLQGIAPEHPRVIAIGARIMRNSPAGDYYEKKLLEIILELKVSIFADQVNSYKVSDRWEFFNHLSIAETCLELGFWDHAVDLLNQINSHVPQQPLLNLVFAKAIVSRVEAKTICDQADVTNHAPSADSLNEQWFSLFDHAIETACRQINDLTNQQSVSEWQFESDLALERIKLWQARGLAAFEPESENLDQFFTILENSNPMAGDFAAYLMATNASKSSQKLFETVKTRFLSLIEKQEFKNDPLILNQLAMLQMKQMPVQSYERAAQSVQQLLNMPPVPMLPLPVAYYLVAKTASQLGENYSAQEAIQQALEAWPDELEWNLFAANLNRLKDEKNQLPNFERAIGYLQKVVNLDPSQIKHYFDLGEACMMAGDIITAITVFEKAAQIYPQNYEIFIRLARAQLAVGDTNGAENNAIKAFQVANKPNSALLLLAEIELEKLDHKKAFDYIQDILESDPEHVAALYLLSKILVKENQLDEAVAVLDRAIALEEDVVPLQIERLKILKMRFGSDQVILEVKYLLELNPDNPKVLVLLMETLDDLGEHEKALEVARSAIQMDDGMLEGSEKVELHYILGSSAFREGQLDQAVHHLSYVIENDPTHIDGLIELGKVYQERRQYKEALEIFNKGIQLAPQDHRSYYNAGLVLKENKEYNNAEHMLRQASKLAPGDTQIHRLYSAVAAMNIIHSRRLVTEDMPTL